MHGIWVLSELREQERFRCWVSRVSIGKAPLKDLKYVDKVLVADTLPKSRIHYLKMTSVITLKKRIERSEAEVEVTRGLSVYLRRLHFPS